MGTVNIDGTNFTIYGTQADADKFHIVALDGAAKAYNGASDDDRARGLVNATRLLDRQAWQGLPVGTPVMDSVLQWPRTGVVDRNGTAVSSASVPDQVIKATFTLAGMIIEDPTVLTQEQSGSNTRRIKAGAVEIEKFQDTLGLSGRFEKIIMELIGQFLSGTSGGELSGSTSYGTDGTTESVFTEDASYGLTRPL